MKRSNPSGSRGGWDSNGSESSTSTSETSDSSHSDESDDTRKRDRGSELRKERDKKRIKDKKKRKKKKKHSKRKKDKGSKRKKEKRISQRKRSKHADSAIVDQASFIEISKTKSHVAKPGSEKSRNLKYCRAAPAQKSKNEDSCRYFIGRQPSQATATYLEEDSAVDDEEQRFELMSNLRAQIDANPGNATAWERLSALHRPLGNGPDAQRAYWQSLLSVLDKACEKCPRSPALRIGQCRTQQKLSAGDLNDQNDECNSVKRRGPNCDALESGWLKLLQDFPTDASVHCAFLEHLFTPNSNNSSSGKLVSDVLLQAKEALSIVAKYLDSTAATAPLVECANATSVPLCELFMVDILDGVCALLQQSDERRAVVLFQAVFERAFDASRVQRSFMHGHLAVEKSGTQNTESLLCKSFATFWSSNSPRVGEKSPGILSGWAQSVDPEHPCTRTTAFRMAVLSADLGAERTGQDSNTPQESKASSSSHLVTATNHKEQKVSPSQLATEKAPSRTARKHAAGIYSKTLARLAFKKETVAIAQHKAKVTFEEQRRAAEMYSVEEDALGVFLLKEKELEKALYSARATQQLDQAKENDLYGIDWVKPFLLARLKTPQVRYELAKRFLRFAGVFLDFGLVKEDRPCYAISLDMKPVFDDDCSGSSTSTGHSRGSSASLAEQHPFLCGMLAAVQFSPECIHSRWKRNFAEDALTRCMRAFPDRPQMEVAAILHLANCALSSNGKLGTLWGVAAGVRELLDHRLNAFDANADKGHDSIGELLLVAYAVDLALARQKGVSADVIPEAFFERFARRHPHLSQQRDALVSRLELAHAFSRISAGLPATSREGDAFEAAEIARGEFRRRCKNDLAALRSRLRHRVNHLGAAVLSTTDRSQGGGPPTLAITVSAFAAFQLGTIGLEAACGVLEKSLATLNTWRKIHLKTSGQGPRAGNGRADENSSIFWSSDIFLCWLYLHRVRISLLAGSCSSGAKKRLVQALEEALVALPDEPGLATRFVSVAGSLPAASVGQSLRRLSQLSRRSSWEAADKGPLRSTPARISFASETMALVAQHLLVDKIFARAVATSSTAELGLSARSTTSSELSFFPSMSLRAICSPNNVLSEERAAFVKSADCVRSLEGSFDAILAKFPNAPLLHRLRFRFDLSCGRPEQGIAKLARAIRTSCPWSKPLCTYLLEHARPYTILKGNEFERQVFDEMEERRLFFLQES